MPISVTRLEENIYHARLSGTYEQQELLPAIYGHVDYIQRFNEDVHAVIVQVDGKWQYGFQPAVMQKIMNRLQHIHYLIFVGWSVPEQVIIRSIGVAFGMKHKFLFYASLDTAILQARHLHQQIVYESAPDSIVTSSNADQLQEKLL